MKPTIRIIKTALLCFLMFPAENAHAQLNFSATFTTTQGQCVDLGIDTNINGITIDSFTILSPPANGQFILLGGLPDSWFYCPDSGFVGTDQAFVYYCVIGGTFPVCDSAQFTFIVEPPSTCSLSVSLQSGSCAGPLPSLMAVVTGGIPPYVYLWSDSSTGSSNCNPNPGVLYCVQVTDSRGCTDVDCDSLSTGCNLSVAIQNGPCAGPLPSLMAIATGGTPPYQYLWNNGNASDVICNLTTGTYCVTVIDANSCSVSSCQQVGGGCQLVATLFMDSSNCLIPVVNGSTPPYTFFWSDNSTGSTLCNVNPLNTYYVIVTDANGCVFTAVYGGGCQLTTVVVVDSMSCGGRNGLTAVITGGDPPYTYQWSDGQTTRTATGLNGGNYTITVTDNNSCTATNSITITSFDTNVYVSAGQTICPQSYVLPIIASGGNSYLWSSGETTTQIQIAPTVTTTYSVTVSNGACSTVLTSTVDVVDPPLANFKSNNVCLWQNATQFINLSTSVLPFDSWYWGFGDGAYVHGIQNPTHTYTASGTYTASLIVTNNIGCIDTLEQLVYVFPLPVADFTSDHLCYDDTTQLADNSTLLTGNIVQWSWNFGDPTTGGMSNTSNLQNPTHKFSSRDTFNVVLTVISDSGCQNTVIKPLLITGPNIGVAMKKDSINPLLWYMHTTTTGTGPFSYLWDFGDGNTSPQPTPSYTYAVAGHYAICLTVTDANGCSSTTCDSTYKMGSLGIIKYLVVTNPTTNIEEENFILVISVSPNPANEILSISSNQPIQGEIIITDIMGRKVFAEMIKDKISNINTSNFPRGYYYLSIVTADHVYYNKIMISR